MAGITDLVSIISGISALIGVGSASVTEVGAARRQWQPPPPQQLVQPQRCPLGPDGTRLEAQLRTLPDGSVQVICVEHLP